MPLTFVQVTETFYLFFSMTTSFNIEKFFAVLWYLLSNFVISCQNLSTSGSIFQSFVIFCEIDQILQYNPKICQSIFFTVYCIFIERKFYPRTINISVQFQQRPFNFFNILREIIVNFTKYFCFQSDCHTNINFNPCKAKNPKEKNHSNPLFLPNKKPSLSRQIDRGNRSREIIIDQ